MLASCGSEGNGVHSHTYGDWEQYSPATCTEDEVLVKKCKDCDKVEYKTGEGKLGHNYEEVMVVVPTQNSVGYTVYRCSRCDDEKHDDYTVLISYENLLGEDEIDLDISSQVLPRGSIFLGLSDVTGYRVVEYRLYVGSNYSLVEIGDVLQSSMKITVIWESTSTVHRYTDWEQYSPATCTDDEVLVRRCLDCGKVEYKKGQSKLGHNHEVYQVVAPTETADGYTIYKCTKCGDEYIADYTILLTYEGLQNGESVDLDIPNAVISKGGSFGGINALSGHKILEYRIYSGNNYTPLNVGDVLNASTKVTVVLAEHEHNFGDWEQYSPATCTEDEVLIRRCSDCDAVEYKKGQSKLGHNYVAYQTVAPTATSDGYTVYRCTRCGDEYRSDYTILLTYESIFNGKSIGIDVQQQIVNKNSTFAGVDNVQNFVISEYRIYSTNTYSTLHLGDSLSSSTKITIIWEEIEHDFGEWEQYSPATCTEDEVLIRRCKNCDEVEYKTGQSKLGHNHEVYQVVPPTSTTDGYTVYRCTRCGDEYRDNYTILLSFNCIFENGEAVSGANLASSIASKGSSFVGVAHNLDYNFVEYRVYSGASYTTLAVGTTLSSSTTITLVFENPAVDDAEFLQVLAKIDKLIELSNSYNTANSLTKNATLRALQYIRLARYTGTTWNMVGGTLESDFADYVTSNQGGINVASLRQITDLNIPYTNENVDFVHMFATMNVTLYGNYSSSTMDLSGWGGDLCQLVQNVKSMGATDADDAKAKAIQLLGSSSGGFGEQDVYADFDSVNIMYRYKNGTYSSFAECMRVYYAGVSKSSRISEFKSNTFTTTYASEDAMASAIVTRLKNNLYISIWCSSNGVNLTDDAIYVEGATRAFAKYIF